MKFQFELRQQNMQVYEEEDLMFNFNSPNKKYPKVHEVDHVVRLLRIVSENINLLDPLDSSEKPIQ